MTYNVVLYKNTGFDLVNRPSEPSILADADKILQQAIFDWQDLDKATIKISADFETVCDVDYARIDNKCYIVTGVRMTSANTAELSLMMDPIATAGGVSSLTAISGWCVRHHVRDDTIFKWTTDEPFVPHRRLAMVTPEKIGPDASYYGDGYIVGLACSTVDLINISTACTVYTTQDVDPTTGFLGSVSVPKLPIVSKPTYVGIQDGNTLRRYILPLSGCYQHSYQGVVDANTDVNKGIQQVRSLGIESAIKNVYVIPSGYISEPTRQLIADPRNLRKYDGLVSIKKMYTPSADFNYKYSNGYTPKNNKAYTLGNTYTVYSGCSGDSKNYEAKDLYANGVSPDFWVYADFGPLGKPFIQPTYFEGNQTFLFQESVSGAQWLDEPIAYRESSGAGFNRQEVARMAHAEGRQVVGSALGAVASLFTSGPAGAVGALAGGVEQFVGNRQGRFDKTVQSVLFTPETNFAADRSIQGYMGNGFYITRTMLEPDDLQAFDNFLTQFGYSDGVPFSMDFLTNRQHFNYVKTEGASVKCSSPLRVRNAIANTLDSGIRLWHELPNAAAMTDNPVV